MGSFFTDILSFQHETAVFDVNPHQLRFVYNTYRFTTLEEIKDFEPELVINAVTVKYTLDAFRQVLPVLPKDCPPEGHPLRHQPLGHTAVRLSEREKRTLHSVLFS